MRPTFYLNRILVALISLGILVAFSPITRAAADKKDEHEKTIKFTDAPDAVQASIKKEVGDAKITKVLEGSDTEGGKATYYEAKYTLNGKKLEVKVAPDGKLISKGDDDD